MEQAVIDPREFGALEAQVLNQGREIAMFRVEQAEMRLEIKELVAIANKGKGAYWAGMLMASGIGATAITLVKWFFAR